MSAADKLRRPPVNARWSVISVVLSHRIGASNRETIGTEKRS